MSSVGPTDRRLLAETYLILDALDESGHVLKAHDRRHRRIVALRILPPRIVGDASALKAFARTIEIAARLKHPNLASVLGVDEDRGDHFVVLQYAEGTGLDRVVRHRGPLSLDQALDIAIQAARGLEAAHAHRIVHGALRPSRLMLDAEGTVRVLGVGQGPLMMPAGPVGESDDRRAADYLAPEQAADPGRSDPRADIYSLGGILYFLLAGREPFVGETLRDRLAAHRERPAPGLQVLRPDVPSVLEATYQRMMAKRPDDRPASMSEVLALLESCKARVPSSATTGAVPRTSGEARAAPIGPEFDLAGLGIEDRTMADPLPSRGTPGGVGLRLVGSKAIAATARADARRLVRPAMLLGLAAAAVVAAVAWRLASRSFERAPTSHAQPPPSGDADLVERRVRDRASEENPQPPPPRSWITRTIFDGKDAKDWMLTSKRPVPGKHVQPDGLNPHGTGSYLVVYRQKLGDFILDFDYQLSPGCNSGVFLRVGDLDDPVTTGIEVSLQDTPGQGYEDPGAIYGLVAPSTNAQKPAGQWNHMTITAQGPLISVVLNGTGVSRINLDEWNVPARHPDGSGHRFAKEAVARLPRTGYLGFQDLIGDCWFKNIVVKTPPS
jgi:hypothetical protein